MSGDADQFDFFVSYARADNADGWVTRFIDELLAEHRKFSGGRELIYFLDHHDIRSFDDLQHRLHHGLARSRLFLAFLSPSYFASEWCRREWKAWVDTEIAKHILSSGSAAIYFVEVPGFVGKVHGLREQAMLDEHEVARQVAELCRLPEPRGDFITTSAPVVRQMRDRRLITADFVLPLQQQGIDALRREDLRRVLERLARDLDERSEHVRLAADSLSTVPPYNKKFSGRMNELLDLRQRLKDDRAGVICGVHGLGGIGKTELAFTFAHAFGSAYPGGRFLIPCDGKSSLRDATLHLGSLFRDQISDEERKAAETYFAAITECLRERLDTLGHILLVLDNVTDMKLVSRQQTDLLTSLGPKLHLLATTHELPRFGENWLKLGELPTDEALEILEKHRPFSRGVGVPPPSSSDDRTAALRIVKRLGGFALAVELVAAWLAAHPTVTYAAFLERLGLEDLEALADAEQDRDIDLRRHDHEHRIEAVLGPTLAALSPVERRAMEYAALLPPDVVALWWLRELVASDFPELNAPPHLTHADPWSNICRTLFRLALLTRSEGATADSRIVRVHRLVQDLIRRDLDTATVSDRQQVVQKWVEARVGVLDQTTRWQDARWEFEPLDALAGLWAETGQERAPWLLAIAASLWQGFAEWTRAEPLMLRALAIDEQSYGAEHTEVAIRLNNLAGLLLATNRLVEAEPLMRRALAIDEQSYGAEHPHVARDLNNLAQLFQATNRLAEAEQLMRRALAIDEQSYGSLPHIRKLFDWRRRALAIDEQSYGTEHPNVVTSLNNLAQLLQTTNRLAEAEPLMRRALTIDEQSYGAEHPRIAVQLNNLAMLLQARNRLTQAEPLMRRALAINEQCYGTEHPDVALNLNNLALLLRARNHLAEAEPLMRRALAIDEQTFGAEHPRVAYCLSNVALLLRATNRLAEAEPLYRRALAIHEKSYGAEHPDVANALSNLATLLQDIDRLAEAEPLMRRALAIFEQSYGAKHPNVTFSIINLARLLEATNRPAEAESLMCRALAFGKQPIGDCQPPIAPPQSIGDCQPPIAPSVFGMDCIPQRGRILFAMRCVKRMTVSYECLPSIGNAVANLVAKTIAALEELSTTSPASRHLSHTKLQRVIQACLQAKKTASRQMEFDLTMEIHRVIQFLVVLDQAVYTAIANDKQTSIQFAEKVATDSATTEAHRQAQQIDLKSLRRATIDSGWADDALIPQNFLGSLWPEVDPK